MFIVINTDADIINTWYQYKIEQEKYNIGFLSLLSFLPSFLSPFLPSFFPSFLPSFFPS
jgi:hypothetical protein